MSTVETRMLEVPGFQVVQFLGSGARSTIWEIRSLDTGEIFALKRVVKRHPSDGKFIEQACNEYEASGHFDHEVVRRTYRMRRVKRWLSLREVHLVMEFCTGRTLQDSRPDSIETVMTIFCRVAEALAHVNARGYVHADIKPNNIIVSENGAVKIIDLGQSCPLGTIKARVQGTPDFIAPEQVHRRPLDARTDVFNFGASIYWTLTGKAIPTAMPRKGAATLKHDMILVPPQELNPAVPPALSKLIVDCVEISPSRRPGSMNEVLSRLKLIGHTLKRLEGPSTEPGPQHA